MATKALGKAEKAEIVKRVQGFIAEGVSHCQEIHTRSESAQKYTRGDQWSEGDLARQRLRDRPAVPWNMIFKLVSSVANREIVSRLVPKIIGKERSDNGIATVLDAACAWQRGLANSEQVESMAFRSAVMCGYGVMHKYWDAGANDGDGMVADEDCPVWECLWPARARKQNLVDRRWHVRGRWITLDEIESRWGDAKGISKKLDYWRNKDAMTSFGVDTGIPMTTSANDSGFGWNGVRAGQWINRANDEAFVVEAEWVDDQYLYRAAVPVRLAEFQSMLAGGPPFQVEYTDPNTEQVTQLQVTRELYYNMTAEQQSAFLDEQLANTEVIDYTTRKEMSEIAGMYLAVTGRDFEDFYQVSKRVTKFAILIEDQVLEAGEREYGFSYHFITGVPFETQDGQSFYGVVDLAKGPQDYLNALISNMIAMYMSSPKATLLMAQSAVPNRDEIANQIASPSSLVVLPDEVMAGGDSKMRYAPQPEYPPMLANLLSMASSGVAEVFGLGGGIEDQSDLRRISGNVVQAASTARNTILAIFFDSMRLFRRMYGICNARFITKMYTVPEIIRIVGEDKLEDVDAVNGDWREIFKFDVVIDEQPTSPTELLELTDFLTRTGMLDNMRNRNDIDFEDMLRFMPQIPESDKREMLKGKTAREQLAQVQEEVDNYKQMSQALYQYFQSLEGGEELLHNFLTMWSNQKAAQGAFSEPGVQPQEPPMGEMPMESGQPPQAGL